jgi:hypothetical protein
MYSNVITTGISLPPVAGIFLSFATFVPALRPNQQPISSKCLKQRSRDIKLTIHLHLMLLLRSVNVNILLVRFQVLTAASMMMMMIALCDIVPGFHFCQSQRFYLTNDILGKVQIMKLLIGQLPLFCCY